MARRGKGREAKSLGQLQMLVGDHGERQPEPLNDLGLVRRILAGETEHSLCTGVPELLEVVAEVAGLRRAAPRPGIASQPSGRSTPGRPVSGYR